MSARRGSSTSRGYDARWQAFRRGVIIKHIQENGPVCGCGCGGRLTTGKPWHADNAEVDHIKAVSGPDDPLFYADGNHQVLRKSCHSTKTRRDQQKGDSGPQVTIGADGWPVS
ncbi:MAG: hypothetical protein CMF31_05120 [Kordiimonas sp.]|nr:hypothetical protein [Kordiimonas sp.]|tara:strand:+ start:539 stop:877 length:339 start_codon:yes stop_codon:yes gene_type:complete